MRIAKPLLMISLSVFLLAVSWGLLTGQFGLPKPARAQTSSPFVAMINIPNEGQMFLAITEAGEVWRLQTTIRAGSITSTSYLGQLGGGAVPTTDESASGLKSRYGGNN